MPGMRHGGDVQQALARMRRAVVDRVMRWRGRPPELAGVREPRRPRPTLPAAAVALEEPPTRLRRLRWSKD
ncbi:MAG: hypothetical protein ACRDNO_28805 [Trebonia sp.]